MPDILPRKLLVQLSGFTPLQRILLSTTGTNQATLSAYHGQPVKVNVLTQTSKPDGRIIRVVEMKCSDRVVCSAESILDIKNPTVRTKIHSRIYGIGQILELSQIRPEFELGSAWKTETHFHREYTLTAPGVIYNILEHFPIDMYT